jgi:hypothetical protein
MPLLRPTAVALLAFLSGCITDGRYVVRGTVASDSGGVTTPIAGASVVVGEVSGNPGRRVVTSADGSYVADYRFGGIYPFIGGERPSVEFSAPGHGTSKVELRSSTPSPGVTRRPCDPPEASCFVLDVVLARGEPTRK